MPKQLRTPSPTSREIPKNKKSVLILYFVLRVAVLLIMVREIFLGAWNNVFFCVLTLVLFMLPSIVERKLRIILPNLLEAIVLLFIFCAEILGELANFYGKVANWDTMLHTINGFLCAAIGFSLVHVLNRDRHVRIRLSAIFTALVAFCFSMTIGVLWEFIEYSADCVFKTDAQKDFVVTEIASVYFEPDGKNISIPIKGIERTVLYVDNGDGTTRQVVIEGGYLDIGLHDTMKDLLVNFAGAVAFSIIGVLYLKGLDRRHLAEKFIPVAAPEPVTTPEPAPGALPDTADTAPPPDAPTQGTP